MPPAVADEFAGFSYAFRFASLEQPQHPDAAAGDAVAVSPFVFEEFAGGLLDERGVVVCHSKGGAQTNQKGITIAIAGITVSPGDLVIGDSGGVAVVPLADAPEILERAQAIVAKEATLRERILQGELLFDIHELAPLLERPDVKETGRSEEDSDR